MRKKSYLDHIATKFEFPNTTHVIEFCVLPSVRSTLLIKPLPYAANRKKAIVAVHFLTTRSFLRTNTYCFDKWNCSCLSNLCRPTSRSSCRAFYESRSSLKMLRHSDDSDHLAQTIPGRFASFGYKLLFPTEYDQTISNGGWIGLLGRVQWKSGGYLRRSSYLL